MFRYDAFIKLDFQKILSACRQGFYQWYISIQLRNLGTIYWVQWAYSQEVGGHSVWSSPPLLEEGLMNMLEGVNRGRSPRLRGERGLGGFGESLPRKFLKIHTWNHAFWCIVEGKIYIFPSRSRNFPKIGYMTRFSIPAKSRCLWERCKHHQLYLGWNPSYIPTILMHFIYSVGPFLDPRLKVIGGMGSAISFPSGVWSGGAPHGNDFICILE